MNTALSMTENLISYSQSRTLTEGFVNNCWSVYLDLRYQAVGSGQWDIDGASISDVELFLSILYWD